MKAAKTHQSDSKAQPHRVFHGSYVLRLWSAESGPPHGYLLDARSGVRYPLSELATLPALIDSIIAKTDDPRVGNDQKSDSSGNSVIDA